LVLVGLSKFILATILFPLALCIQLPIILRKWFVTTVLILPTCLATSQNFVQIFDNDSEAILLCISALCFRGQTFPSQERFKKLQIIFI